MQHKIKSDTINVMRLSEGKEKGGKICEEIMTESSHS